MDLWDVAQKTGVIAAVGTVVNALIRWMINWVTSRYYLSVKTYLIKANTRLPAELADKKIKFQCLVIRYGTDQYIEKMASDIDRQNGQLQNKVIDIKTKTDPGSKETEFSLALPVHSRLGTQFKCFADIDETLSREDKDSLLNQLKAFLESTKIVSDVSISSSEHQHRVYFLLNRFGSVTTVDGFLNNHCFPH
jgi:hypothetical protein